MNLIILTDDDRISPNRYELRDERFRHICSVLSAQVGDLLRVGVLNGPVGQARIVELTDSKVTLLCEELTEQSQDPLVIDLICAVPRPKTLRKVYGVAAALGVRSIHLVRANRTDKSYLESPLLKSDGFLPPLIEGLAQAKRTRLPVVAVHSLFRPFVEDELPEITSGGDGITLKLLADSESSSRLQDVYSRSVGRIVLVVGPEGGWVPFESGLFIKQGFRPFSMGPWTLRVETALTAGLAQIEQVRSIVDRQ
jgi:RsmE family RNA methyltransferase